ncbi:MAG: hypothetical protein COB67_13050 [SAR324 cluster bacterium]|uniref:Uncharacterized protein n=1 Tax=SAR324 cluster bacterium TaxID=2024889 RepID=A0A2A4SPG6_9DELT|nr:MAG: hypothetical protein COB67_13050 [SAR324 cluster bacterium]
MGNTTIFLIGSIGISMISGPKVFDSSMVAFLISVLRLVYSPALNWGEELNSPDCKSPIYRELFNLCLIVKHKRKLGKIKLS